MRLGERYEETEIEYRGGRVIQRWRGSSGNVRLSHLLMSFLLQSIVQIHLNIYPFTV